MAFLDDRLAVARFLLAAGTDDLDGALGASLDQVPTDLALTADLNIAFPAGLEPTPQPLAEVPDPDAALPHADVVVVTWTVAEQRALADVLTPGQGPATWYRYTRRFEEHYRPLIRGGAPSVNSRFPRLGSWMPTRLGGLDVLCVKSELHLNQDGKKTGEGTATLPVRDFFDQILDEVQPSLIITAGTAGSVFADFPLGDVVVSRAAKFRCHQEFRNEKFNGQEYRSGWEVPTGRLAQAQSLMDAFAGELSEPPLGPPSTRYPFPGGLVTPPANNPTIRIEQGGRDMPEFHPILTTDYFGYGTSTTGLEREGAAVEMGDAVLGMACAERTDPPH